MGKKLDWDNMPPIGTEVVYVSGATAYRYDEGKTYTIGEDRFGDVGPLDNDGNAPPIDIGESFNFEIVEKYMQAYELADGSLSTDYEVGDEFVVVSRTLWSGACIGDVVKLSTDDKSSCSPFTNVTKGVPCYPYWKNLKRHTKQFTKSDLKDGMRVEYASGWVRFVIQGNLVNSYDGEIYNGSNLKGFNDDLSRADEPLMTIIKVTDRDGTVLFERKPVTKKVTLDLTDEQIEKLKTQLGIDI